METHEVSIPQVVVDQVVTQEASIIRSPLRSIGGKLKPPSVPVIDKCDVHIPNLQSMSMVASLKLFRLQQQLAGIETESDESSDEWKPVQQLYNPMAKQMSKKKSNMHSKSDVSDAQYRGSRSSYESYMETDVDEHYSRSTSS